VKLTVVGCSGSGPGPKSPASCYLVEHDGFRLLLDLGNGAFGPLQNYAAPASIDALFLSHLHADHCLDAAPFVVWHRYAGPSPRAVVPLYAPVGAERRIALAYDDDGDGRSMVYTGDTGPSAGIVELARGADVLLAEAAHPPGPGLPVGLHLTGREAGEHAAAAEVGRLLLTHIPAWVDEIGQLFAASAVFSETELVHSGAMYEI
jgi:ribonuclease BN (tRNA processing enzyme)